MKSGYELAQRTGINTFNLYGERITVIHPGSSVEYLHPGQVLLLRRMDNLYWAGRVFDDAFIFLLGNPVPVAVENAFAYLRAAWCMDEAHKDKDFINQGELDF